MMVCTPSPRRKPFEMHLHRTSTPTRSDRRSSNHFHKRSPSQDSTTLSPPQFILFHSPFKSPLRNQASTPQRQKLSLDVQDTDDSDENDDPLNNEDPSSDEMDENEDQENTQGNDDGGIFSAPRNPKTPAARRSRLFAITDPRGRHRPNLNLDLGAATPTSRIPPPCFNNTGTRMPPLQQIPQTPAAAVDWRNFAGADSMTKLSLHDPHEAGKAKERRRTDSITSYMPARHKKAISPPSSLRRSVSPIVNPSESILRPSTNTRSTLPPSARQRLQRFNKSVKYSQDFEIGEITASPRFRSFPQIHFDDPPTPSLIDSLTAAATSEDPFPLIEPQAIRDPASPHIRPRSPPFIDIQPPTSPNFDPATLSASTSSTSNTSSSFSFDDVKPPQDMFKPPKLARKFKPRDSGVGGVATDDSDIGDLSFSGLGDMSFNSSVSFDLGAHSGGELDQNEISLVTPALAPASFSGWPGERSFGNSGQQPPASSGMEGELDLEEFFHTARSSHNASGAKPVMPDTPMKKLPMKIRNWQTAVKAPASNPAFSTLRAAPRKSLPLQLSDFQPECPGSPESDPSPSKSSISFARPSAVPRRKSYGMVGIGLPVADQHLGSSVDSSRLKSPVLPLLARADFLRRTSSGAFSTSSDGTSEGSMMGTPTKRAEPQVRFLPNNTPNSAGKAEGSQPSSTATTPSQPSSSNTHGPTSTAMKASRSTPLPSVPHRGSTFPLNFRVPVPPTPGSGPFSLSSSADSSAPVRSLRPARPSLPALFAGENLYRHDSAGRRESHAGASSISPLSQDRFTIPPLSIAKVRSTPMFGAPSLPIAGSSSRPPRKSLPKAERRGDGNDRLAVPSVDFKRRMTSRTRAESLAVGEDDYKSKARCRSRSLTPDVSESVVMERPGHFETYFVKPADNGSTLVGKGTFGQVFRVAMKPGNQLPATSISLGTGGTSPSQVMYAVKRSKSYEGNGHRNRLLEEVDVLRHLTFSAVPGQGSPSGSSFWQGHPNVLHYVDAWEQDRMLFIQTELCELGNLSDFLSAYGQAFDRLDESRLWKIAAEISNGLHHIHSNGVLHLDLKPANIFVTAEGRIRIGDFGMATRWPRPNSSKSGYGIEREGDREYLAAEVLRGTYGPEADIFSFGMIMLESAGNIVVPSNGDPWHKLRSEDFSEVPFAGFTVSLVAFIISLMRADPTRRPTITDIQKHQPIARSSEIMRKNLDLISRQGEKPFRASAFAAEPAGFVQNVVGKEESLRIVEQVDGSTPIVKQGDPMDLS